MKHWSAQRVAGTAGAQLVREQAGGRAAGGPARAVIDSRAVQPGDLFFGLPGENVDGGAFAAAALDAGAWGVVVAAAVGRRADGDAPAARSSPPRRRCRRSARSPAAGGRTSPRS